MELESWDGYSFFRLYSKYLVWSIFICFCYCHFILWEYINLINNSKNIFSNGQMILHHILYNILQEYVVYTVVQRGATWYYNKGRKTYFSRTNLQLILNKDVMEYFVFQSIERYSGSAAARKIWCRFSLHMHVLWPAFFRQQVSTKHFIVCFMFINILMLYNWRKFRWGITEQFSDIVVIVCLQIRVVAYSKGVKHMTQQLLAFVDP